MRIIVTDHALVRYLERVVGVGVPNRWDDRRKLAAMARYVDVEGVRARIAATPRLAEAVAANASAMEINGFRFILKNAYVVTVGPAAWKHQADGISPDSKLEYRRNARRCGLAA